jgi:hypothetical protein
MIIYVYNYLSLVRSVVKCEPLLARVLWLSPLLPPLPCVVIADTTSVSESGSLWPTVADTSNPADTRAPTQDKQHDE